MADQLQLRGGTTAQHATFTGALREVTVDTDKKTVVVHDGSTAGGNPLLRQDLSNLPAGTIDNADINASAGIVDTKLATIATAGKVSNSATTATNANTASAIVARDGSGNFTAGTITAALTGAASSNVLKAGDTMTGVLAVTAGTAALPAITPSGDPNTGIYSPGTDQLAIATGGVQRLLVDASGVVTATGDLQVASLNGGPLAGTRNRIINGDMRIDQRNAGAAVTPTVSGTYTLDRWLVGLSQASKFSVQFNAGSVTPPTGFTGYLGVTSTSAYSLATGDYFWLDQRIEGLNMSDLSWGTVNAKTVTLSFWVRSSLTGTFGGAVQNGGARSYPYSYTISAANTWEQKTIQIPGDTTGTWATGTTAGMLVMFGLGVGATASGTAGSWAGANYISATGATSVVGTSGATFYITGVQLEPGSTATPFERRSYGQELALCQRYYEKSYNQQFAPGSAVSAGSVLVVGSNGSSCGGTSWKISKRAVPTVVVYAADGTSAAVNKLASGTKVTGATAADIGENGFRYVGCSTTVESHQFQFSVSAEL